MPLIEKWLRDDEIETMRMDLCRAPNDAHTYPALKILALVEEVILLRGAAGYAIMKTDEPEKARGVMVEELKVWATRRRV